MDDQQRHLFRALRRARWTINLSGNGHWHIRKPDGRLAAVAAVSGSDWRGHRNLIRDLRRAGFRWPNKQ